MGLCFLFLSLAAGALAISVETPTPLQIVYGEFFDVQLLRDGSQDDCDAQIFLDGGYVGDIPVSETQIAVKSGHLLEGQHEVTVTCGNNLKRVHVVVSRQSFEGTHPPHFSHSPLRP
jgi:hypothetical protein